MDDETKNDGMIAAVRALVEDYAKPKVETLSAAGVSAPFAMMPGAGPVVVPASVFDAYRTQPRFRHGTAAMLSLDSLIDHTNRFKDEGSMLFADDDRSAPSIMSVLDYHPAGEALTTAPRFGKHRATFNFPLSDEWKAWTEFNKTPLKMAAFAEFVEERIIDVLHLIPEEDELSHDLQKFISACGGEAIIATPQKLVELSRGLKVNESSVIKEVVNLGTGEGQILFSSEHSDSNGQPLRVPSLFLIAIPVFRNGPLYRLAARLRYRKTAEGILFWYDLWRADRVFDHAFKEGCERAQVETELPLLFGKPE
ncbi:Uncharacterized conserved protein YfdQ, DUF2303 family [Sphingobium sp. YR657]|uniref:DUF2303 family protein n=1 Tax=Sphingobium sp. YR657 TaxID=1884366 RepID=UPI0009110561|nr:DUF2303 family protein [Sphingobium sp. YR657]SHL97107.1 Uncharacterized conserved protein YfdQ, DUF2303 family [Sphingobium sp. YR657]